MQALSAAKPFQVEGILESMPDEQKNEFKKRYPMASFHPYRLKLLLQNSQRYNNRETLEALELIDRAIRKLFQSGSSKRLLLETLTASIISKQRTL